MKKTLEVCALLKQYGNVCAVDMVSFNAQKGEIIALLGPNGAGKSTLLNMISGLLAPDSGIIKVCETEINTGPDVYKGNIGFLAEGAPMYGDMTVEDFLSYMAALKGVAHAQVRTAEKLAQIEDVKDMRIENLSKGYKRRVGFAQSILSDPPLLLLDEPTDGLDPNQKEHIRQLIKAMGKNKTIIISTHLLDDVEEMCNRIMIMNQGKIVADGDKSEVLKSARARSLATAFKKLTGGVHA